MEIEKDQKSETSSTSSHHIINIKIIDTYAINKNQKIGQGSYGSVFSGTDKNTGQQVAIKAISTERFQNGNHKMIQNILNEQKCMKLVNHENIVKLLDVKQSKANLYFIVEYCNGGDLLKFLQQNNGKLSEKVALRITQEIVQGFQCLHENKIVHRDLKPANILLHNNQVKISDFGFSRVIDEGNMNQEILNSYVGSPQYMSPQILQNKKYSSKTDIWSLGFMLYEMLYGQQPYTGNSVETLLGNIIKNPLKFYPTPIISEQTKQLLQKMLEVDDHNRIDWETLFNFNFSDLLSIAQIKSSLELSKEINDKLMQAKFKSLLYFSQTKVLTNDYDCKQRNDINNEFTNFICQDEKEKDQMEMEEDIKEQNSKEHLNLSQQQQYRLYFEQHQQDQINYKSNHHIAN